MNKVYLLIIIGLIIIKLSPIMLSNKIGERDNINRNIIYVGGNGSGNFSTIGSAINIAQDGDTIYVYSGEYHEIIMLSKSLTLLGEDKNTTIIDGDKNSIVVWIYADNCRVANFTIIDCKVQASDWTYGVVKIQNHDNNIVENCIIEAIDTTGNYWLAPVYILDSSYNIIKNNHISEKEMTNRVVGIAVRGDSSYNRINGNYISNYIDGIEEELESGGYNQYISNYIYRNGWGIDLLTGTSANISYNDIIENRYDGISILKSHNNLIAHNSIIGNGWKTYDYGINIWSHSYSNTIAYNYVADTDNIGIFSLSSRSNTYIGNTIENNRVGLHLNENGWTIITQNNFIDNRQKQTDITVPMFGLLCRGNFWSDYRGHGPYFFQGHMYGPFNIFVWFWIFIDWYPAQEPFIDIKNFEII